MRILLTLLILAANPFGLKAEEGKSADSTFQIHGRLSLYNGNPGFRIWIVDTKRILGVAESPPEKPMMPAGLYELTRDENFVFADFTVAPLTKDEPGVMRMVRVVRAERIVVTDRNLIFIRRIDTPITNEASK